MMSRLTYEEMAQAILDLTAGQDTMDSFRAQADALASGIGGTMHLSGYTKEEAMEFMRELSVGMVGHIETHWGSILGNSH